jgi:2-polyprenyl-3-methyl-5-hydroxy-6-metoxy-1,4-benzoquinol methylase
MKKYTDHTAHEHWLEAQEWEKNWWSDCLNTYGEETKQLSYAKRMGLQATAVYGKYPVYDLKGRSVIDLGGGASSILLKCINFKEAVVVDPLPIPDWCKARYTTGNIIFRQQQAEQTPIPVKKYDEAWIYNVLQHTEDPTKILNNALKIAHLVRIFEWIDTPPEDGHPITLTEEFLNKTLKGEGHVEWINENRCVGKCFYGIFRGI